jgi:transposase
MSDLDKEWTKILGWPGYRVYRHEINEKTKTLKLWVPWKSGNQKLLCGGCGQRVHEIREIYEREVRDLPWGDCQVTVVIELYPVECDCGGMGEPVLPPIARPQLMPVLPPSRKRVWRLPFQLSSAASSRAGESFASNRHRA